MYLKIRKNNCLKIYYCQIPPFIMHWWSVQHRSFALEAFFRINEYLAAARRAFRTHFNLVPRATLPSNRSISKLVKHFRQHGNVAQRLDLAAIPGIMLENAMKNFNDRLQECIDV